MALGTDYILKYIADTGAAVQGAKALEQLNKDVAATIGSEYLKVTRTVGQSMSQLSAPRPIKINGQEAIQQTARLGQVVQLTDGSYQNLVKTVTLVNGQAASVKTTMSDVTGQFRNTNLETEKNAKNFLTMGENMDRLAKRALLTIPVWLALRTLFTTLPRAIGDSVKSLIDLDLALQKVKRNMSGTPQEIEANFLKLQKTVREVSLSTGVDSANIAEAVKKFASLGFEMNEALAGGVAATKLSVVLFGDAAETADSFARALNLLIDRSKGAAPATQQMNELFALTAELEKTNQFEINEVNEALKNFGNTAKSFNISGKDTLAILATLGTNLLEGARGGTLASTAFQQMFANLDKVSRSLGVNVNPNVDSTVQILLKVVTAISDLNKANPQKATEAINELFGGVKGGKVVRSLISDLERLRANLNITADASSLDVQLNNVLKSVSGQAKLFDNLRKQIGITFAQALTGASDFEGALEDINKGMLFLKDLAQVAGEDIRTALSVGILPLSDAVKTETDKLNKNIIDFNDKLIAGLKGQLGKTEIINLLDEIETKIKEAQNTIKTDLAIGNQRELLKTTAELNSLYANQDILKTKLVALEQQITVETTKKAVIEKSINEEATIAFADRQKIMDLVLNSQLDILKSEGATQLQILQANIEWRKRLGLIDESTNKQDAQLKALERQLDTEKAINEEKKLQGKLSSDAVKLFDIAKTEGVNVAKQIGDVLAGNTSLDTFIRAGGRAAEVFQKEFADLFKQKQAEAFFKGEVSFPGVNQLGFGGNIPIPGNEAIRGVAQLPLTDITVAQSQVERNLQRLTNNVVVPVNNNFNINAGSIKELQDAVVKKLSDSLPQTGTQVNKALSEAFEGKQSTAR